MRKLIFKAILYRIGAIIIGFSFFYLVFKKVKEATIFTIYYELLQTLWYLLYEKFWKKYKKNIFK